ncbi:MAG: phosphopantetheine-binding protein [Flavobacteriaceae bacterium]|jgi:acyl carrier protein
MKKLLEIINTVLDNRDKLLINDISESSDLRNDCTLDSLDLAELTVRIEAEFDVDIFEDGIVTSVGEIINKINLNTKSGENIL